MWEISIHNQILTFLWSVILGLASCFLYDIIRAVRKVYKWQNSIVFVCDILLWIMFAFVTFLFLISRTNGEIRSYVLLGELLGFVILRISVSRFLFKFFVFIFLKFKQLCDYVKYRFYLIFAKFEKIIMLLLQKTAKFFVLVLKTAKKLLQYVCKLLYTNKNNASMESVSDEEKAKT